MAAQSNCYFLSSNCPCRFPTNRGLGTPSFRRLRNWSRKGCVEVGRRRLRLVNAQLPTSLSVNIGLDSQGICYDDSSQFPWVGPLPGDIAEVEAYCRIFRAAEQFHDAMMDVLCNQLTGVVYDSREDKPLLADKIISILGCMVCLLNKGKDDVLSGRSSIMKSFRELSRSVMDDNLPPLATFRCEMKSYCESLHGAVGNFFTPGDDRSSNVWRKLQRLKNVCYDSGFPRQDNHPCQTLLANWSPVPMSTSREGAQSENSEIAFWKGGQVTEESLKWLLGKGFRTIIDLRAESVKDNFYETAVHEAVSSGKIELIKLPVEVGAIPSVEQVVQFYVIVSDSSKTPIYVHSKEGKRRTFAMISRWRRYMHHITSITKQISTSDLRAQDALAIEGALIDQDPPDTEYQSLTTDGADNTLITNQGTDMISVERAMGSTFDSCEDVKPMESQLPLPDILCRKETPKFLKDRSMSSQTHFSCEQTRLNLLSKLSCNAENNMNGSLGSMESSKAKDMATTNRSCQDPSVIFGPTTHLHKSSSAGAYDRRKEKIYINSSNDPDKNATSIMVTGQDSTDVENYFSSEDESLDMIERSMCSSTTGVVRVQSRMKAEMFLVRADEFSCIREKVRESSLAFTHPSTQQQMLLWKSTPRTVLLLKKLGRELLEEAKEVASFLYYQEKMNVLVEPEIHEVFAKIPGFGFVQTFYSPDISDLHERVDLVACLGGDGVILHASTLFRGSVPPVVSFHLGSLGFLTSHTFDNYKKDLQHVIHGNNTVDGVYVTLRMRLLCEIYRKGKAMPGKIFSILNEVVVDRGSNPYLSKIECYDHDRLITKVQGDGVIIATPTGSTAYSSSAGGSMVHPNVPCMLFTPICPHSLSFRPIILPDSAQLELKIPEDARSNAWVSFDGKRRQQLSRGDSVKISMSQHPLPTVNNSDQTGDWFGSLIRCLNWNERQDQKAI